MTATELLIDPSTESDEATTATGDQTPEVILAAATPAPAAEPVPTETDTALADAGRPGRRGGRPADRVGGRTG